MNEFKESLVKAVNESGLPIIISAQILGEVQQLCIDGVRKQEADYYEALNKESEDKNNGIQ